MGRGRELRRKRWRRSNNSKQKKGYLNDLENIMRSARVPGIKISIIPAPEVCYGPQLVVVRKGKKTKLYTLSRMSC